MSLQSVSHGTRGDKAGVVLSRRQRGRWRNGVPGPARMSVEPLQMVHRLDQLPEADGLLVHADQETRD